MCVPCFSHSECLGNMSVQRQIHHCMGSNTLALFIFGHPRWSLWHAGKAAGQPVVAMQHPLVAIKEHCLSKPWLWQAAQPWGASQCIYKALTRSCWNTPMYTSKGKWPFQTGATQSPAPHSPLSFCPSTTITYSHCGIMVSWHLSHCLDIYVLIKNIHTVSDIIKLCNFSDSSSCFSTRWDCDSR